jgi:uncharacterized protein with PQ loop repeat
MEFLIQLGAVAGFVLPFFNIPLILHMVRRKSSDDISLVWVIGVEVCILLMSPSALTSKDIAFRAFGITNLIFFTAVAFTTLWYRKNKQGRF